MRAVQRMVGGNDGRSSLAWLTLLVGACSAPREEAARTLDSRPEAVVDESQPSDSAERARDSEPAKPWTKAFEQRSVLLANQVRVEGPLGLLDHLYYDGSLTHVQHAETVPEGYLQTVSVRPGSNERIRAELDGLRLEVLEQLTLLERVAPGPVRVSAQGQVWWRDLDGKEERGETWERSGVIEE
mgnify:CR=1 FL=1